MLSGLFEQSSNGAKFIAAFFIILISIIALTAIGLLLSFPIFNLDIVGLKNLLGNMDYSNISFMKYFQTVISLGTFVIPPFIIAYVFKGEITKYLLLNKKPQLFFARTRN